ncbi:hypothetical protein [Nocardioides sp. GY 10127]|uniref:hypothetical protein n=1 Tax=Nocardioides sp. GY 10127 TaxID=2569762 RepID=UPI0010A764F6|nr:hypothetical protein [Nocardioides sp. GY 10127]TIC81652.1 hypothetical protein E8D37_10645 [Nocardioides sp. GY 10127]
MIGGHLGNRAGALLDGQLPPAEAERWWAHVQGCHGCRDLVEREGWVKDRLSGLSTRSGCQGGAPDSLKGLLKGGPDAERGHGLAGHPSGDMLLAMTTRPPRPWKHVGIAAGVGGAAGAAVFGFAAATIGFGGAAPVPASSITQPVSQTSSAVPTPAASAATSGPSSSASSSAAVPALRGTRRVTTPPVEVSDDDG